MPSFSLRRRRAARPTAKRTTLEARLEDIVTLLQNKPAAPTDSPAPSTRSSEENPASDDSSCESLAATTLPDPRLADPGSSGSPATTPSSSSSEMALPSCLSQPNDPEAEKALQRFQNRIVGFFPFVYIPSTTTARQLREQYPFLWLNIMAVAYQESGRQRAMSEFIKQYVAQKMVIHHEKSLDLLLGLLAFIGWYAVTNPYVPKC